MNYSSILIAFDPDRMNETLERVGGIEGVEVFQIDEPNHRAIAVIEAPSTGREVSAFETVQKLDGVVDVSLINHYFADEEVPSQS